MMEKEKMEMWHEAIEALIAKYDEVAGCTGHPSGMFISEELSTIFPCTNAVEFGHGMGIWWLFTLHVSPKPGSRVLNDEHRTSTYQQQTTEQLRSLVEFIREDNKVTLEKFGNEYHFIIKRKK